MLVGLTSIGSAAQSVASSPSATLKVLSESSGFIGSAPLRRRARAGRGGGEGHKAPPPPHAAGARPRGGGGGGRGSKGRPPPTRRRPPARERRLGCDGTWVWHSARVKGSTRRRP